MYLQFQLIYQCHLFSGGHGLIPDFAMITRSMRVTPFTKQRLLVFFLSDGVDEQKIGNDLKKFL